MGPARVTFALWWFFAPDGGAEDGGRRRGPDRRVAEKPVVAIPHDHPDAALIDRIRAGEDAAIEMLFHQLYATLVMYATRTLRDESAAEDVVQTVFVELWRRHATFAPVSGVRPYLFAAVRNRARDRRRGERRADHYTDRYDIESDGGFASRTPADELEQREQITVLHAALDQLAPRAREALVLVRDHGLSYREAAHVMGVSVNTVKTQLARAIAMLRAVVGPLLTVLVAHRG